MAHTTAVSQGIVKKKHSKVSASQIIIYALLIFWAITTIYPFFWVIMNSFKLRGEIVSNSFALPFGELFTTANYERAFSRTNIFEAYGRSIIISGTVTVVVVLLAGFASYALARYEFRGRKILQSLVLASMMFPVFSTIIPVFRMEYSWGIVNTRNVWFSMLSTALPQIAGNLSFSIIVLCGYIRGLSVDLEEAAFLEGCNARQIFFKIIFPICRPSFATIGIFSFLWSYNDLFTQMFFLGKRDHWAITRLLQELTSMEGTDYGLMAAAVTIVVVPVIIVYILLQKNIIKGLTAGAIKG